MKIHEIVTLINQFGKDATLESVLNKIQNNKIYVCPKCNGKGHMIVEYNCYPRGLPDSGFVYEAAYKDVECDLCNGDWYTDKQYVPKFIQDGFEVK